MFCKFNVNDLCRSRGIPFVGVDHDPVFSIYMEVFACLELTLLAPSCPGEK